MLGKKPEILLLNSTMRARLKRLGKRKHCSTEQLVQEAIARYLDEEEYVEKLDQETLERWQEVEQGKVVSHEAVSTWLKTWGTKAETGRPACGT